MLTPQSSVESIEDEGRRSSSWSVLRHKIRGGGLKSPAGNGGRAALGSLMKLASQERSMRATSSLKESQSCLSLEIHRLRERVQSLENQLMTSQSLVRQTEQQFQALFHQVQEIDTKLRYWPPDGSTQQNRLFRERQRQEFLLSQALHQIRNGNYRLRRCTAGVSLPSASRQGPAGSGDEASPPSPSPEPKINKCPLVREIEAVRGALKKKETTTTTTPTAAAAAAESEANSKAGSDIRCQATAEDFRADWPSAGNVRCSRMGGSNTTLTPDPADDSATAAPGEGVFATSATASGSSPGTTSATYIKKHILTAFFDRRPPFH